MNSINSYHFGEIVVTGEKYSSDVIIFPGRVEKWRSAKSHELGLGDITLALSESPEVLILGTGAYDRMTVLPEVPREVLARNIKLVVSPTGEACNMYNFYAQEAARVIAILHLTC